VGLGRAGDQRDLPVAQLEQVVHDLLGAAAVVAHHVVQRERARVVVHHDERVALFLEVLQEPMAVVEAKAQDAVHEASFEELDVLALLDEVGLGLLEHDLVAELSRTVANAAHQLAEVRVGKAVTQCRGGGRPGRACTCWRGTCASRLGR
jgi:hypothetical protein